MSSALSRPARRCCARPSWRLRTSKQVQAQPEAHAGSSSRSLHIGFYSNHLCERGSEVALYDYADFAESLKGATSYILYDATSQKNVPMVVDKFRARFGERIIALGAQSGSFLKDIEPAIDRHGISHCYIIKYGHINEPSLHWFGKKVVTLVHAVFEATTPHGHVYARISPCVPWQVKVRPGKKSTPVPVVPHIVRRAVRNGPDLRAELDIPPSATVFGRHGGIDTFNIPDAKAAVLRVAHRRPDVYFVLMNTQRLAVNAFGAPLAGQTPRNVIHLEPTADEERKAAFLRTCDAMLHARGEGESFGLAIGEFSAMGKPILTSEVHVMGGMADFHVRTLGDRGLFWRDQPSCERLLLEFDRRAAKAKGAAHWNAYRPFEPERVMDTFWRTFIETDAARATQR